MYTGSVSRIPFISAMADNARSSNPIVWAIAIAVVVVCVGFAVKLFLSPCSSASISVGKVLNSTMGASCPDDPAQRASSPNDSSNHSAPRTFTQSVLLCTGNAIREDSPDASHPTRRGPCEINKPYFLDNTFIAQCSGGKNPARDDGLWHQGSRRLPQLPPQSRITKVKPDSPVTMNGNVVAVAEVGPADPISTTINIYCRVLNDDSPRMSFNVEVAYVPDAKP